MTDENLTRAELAKLAARADAVNEAVQHGRMFFNTGEHGRVDDYLFEAQENTQELARTLRRHAGAQESSRGGADLASLARMDTPAARRLLGALRDATAAAEVLDAERGNVLPAFIPLQPGESRGTGWAETLSELVLRLRLEVEGPRGGGRE